MATEYNDSIKQLGTASTTRGVPSMKDFTDLTSYYSSAFPVELSLLDVATAHAVDYGAFKISERLVY